MARPSVAMLEPSTTTCLDIPPDSQPSGGPAPPHAHPGRSPPVGSAAVALEVNRPDVVADVKAAFDGDEAALITNDVDALDSFFWDSAKVVRFGVADRQYGAAEIAAFRRNAPSAPPPRTLENTVVTTFGSDMAV